MLGGFSQSAGQISICASNGYVKSTYNGIKCEVKRCVCPAYTLPDALSLCLIERPWPHTTCHIASQGVKNLSRLIKDTVLTCQELDGRDEVSRGVAVSRF